MFNQEAIKSYYYVNIFESERGIVGELLEELTLREDDFSLIMFFAEKLFEREKITEMQIQKENFSQYWNLEEL